MSKRTSAPSEIAMAVVFAASALFAGCGDDASDGMDAGTVDASGPDGGADAANPDGGADAASGDAGGTDAARMPGDAGGSDAGIDMADSDGDGIRDVDEGRDAGVDTDGDGTPDYEDVDSDDDGISDADESGDDDPSTAPVDTDGDSIPDFRDLDSDDDGLSDADESAAGTDATAADTDGDGVDDLVESAAGTDPTDDAVDPRTHGDLVYVLPFESDPQPATDTIEVKTWIRFADVYFLFDISNGMAGEIDSLQGSLTALVDELTCADEGVACVHDADCASGQVCSLDGTCKEDPLVDGCVGSVWTGAGYYESQYWHTDGPGGDGVTLQDDPSVTSTAMAAWATFGGTEELFQAAWGVADPSSAPNAVGCEPSTSGRIGCPAYREEAVRTLVAVSDEDSDGTETASQAGDALSAARITFAGIWAGSEGSTSRADMEQLASASGSEDGSGSPLVFDGAGTAVGPAVASALRDAFAVSTQRLTIEATDEPGDAGDALELIDYFEVETAGPACEDVVPREDTDSDGHDDAFSAVPPGTGLCWSLVPARNTAVEATDAPQLFEATVTVLADGAPLERRKVYFVVPVTRATP